MLTKRTLLASAMATVLSTALLGCGGGSSSTPTPTSSVNVVPALGAVYSAPVQLLDASGNVLASGLTGAKGTSDAGKATLNVFSNVSGPVVVKVSLAGATYYDERLDRDVTVAGTSSATLLSMAPALASTTSLGVTPLSNMAAKLAGVGSDGRATVALTPTVVAQGVVKANLAVGLPVDFNILAAPSAVASSAATLPTSGYGALIANMALSSTSDALTQATTLATAVSPSGVVSANVSVLTSLNSVLSAANVAGVAVSAPVTDNTQLSSSATTYASQVLQKITPAGATGATGSTGPTGGVN